MPTERNYWTSIFQKRLSRRKALSTVIGAGLGYAGLSQLGCASGRQQQAEQNQGGSQAKPEAAQPTSTPSGVQPKRGGTLKYDGTDGTHWDPNLGSDASVTRNISRIYSGLTSIGAGGPDPTTGETVVSSWLAESWEIPDPTTYIFKLRKGVKFHNIAPVNGREMTSEDVKYSYDRVRDKQTGNTEVVYRTEDIVSVEAPDKYTVRIKLSQPVASFLVFTAGIPFWVTARESVEKYGDLKKVESAIGTGPWQLDKYEAGVKIAYKRHPDFFIQGRPYLDNLETIFFKDSASRMAALRAGSIDATGVSRADWPSLKQTNPDIYYDEFLVASSAHLYFKQDRPPFNDVRVRRAVALAIDWDGFNKSFLLGAGVMNGPLSPVHGKYFLPFEADPSSAQWYKLDPDRSKQLLAEAGYPNGFSTSIMSITGYGPYLELIAANLAKVGINAKLDLKTDPQFYASGWVGKFEGMAFRAPHYYADIDYQLLVIQYPGQPHVQLQEMSPDLKKMVQQIKTEMNETTRLKVVQDAQKLIRDQVYNLAVPFAPLIWAMQPYVKNLKCNQRVYCQGGWDKETLETWFDK